MSSRVGKIKMQENSSVEQKLELIKKLKSGMSVVQVCVGYGEAGKHMKVVKKKDLEETI